ncbi:transmembrane signal receptor [Lithospermum erythrorhizon]|uniref:Transmembrane signal receptor n=1 Tax=Lithospermum erythrorhizon TaxID=34254 RepID=A0AAV3S056_LITER
MVFLKMRYMWSNLCPYEHTLYVKRSESGDIIIVCLYVDDLIFSSNNEKLISEFKEALVTKFEMTDMGMMSYFLGLEVLQTRDGIFISQKKFACDILKKFRMMNSKPVTTPIVERMMLSRDEQEKNVNVTTYKNLIGSLRYLVATRPDISFRVGLLSSADGIFYSGNYASKLVGYTDSDWVGDVDSRRSTSGYAFYHGSTIFSWSSKKQQVVALSTVEAEYIVKQDEPTTIYCDNKSSIALSKNPVFHGRSKHIDIKYHKIRELVAEKEINVEHCSSESQVADIFTKPLKMETFFRLKKFIGMINVGDLV